MRSARSDERKSLSLWKWILLISTPAMAAGSSVPPAKRRPPPFPALRQPPLCKEAIENTRVSSPPSRLYSGDMPETVTKPKTRVKTKVERPRLHKVILVNDDFTPREFVVTVLKGEFRMTEDQAYKVMITAHKLGVCVVAVFTKDVAETKATRATDAGRAKGYPLLFTTEPEE
jgi:ATP-dependent Clp protease adaptor protein ClpS